MRAEPAFAPALTPVFAALTPTLVVLEATLSGTVAAHPPRRLRATARQSSWNGFFTMGRIGLDRPKGKLFLRIQLGLPLCVGTRVPWLSDFRGGSFLHLEIASESVSKMRPLRL